MGSHASQIHVSGHAGGGHALMHLPPAWLGIVAALVFVAIAASHLRHFARTGGQRRPWHACHVLAAVGMAFMYAPAAIDPLHVPTLLWQSMFACAGILAAMWALGGVGPVPTLMWLITSIDLGAMIYMWSPGSETAPVSWLLVVYFVAQAGLWASDAYRRVDGRTPVIRWSLMSDSAGNTRVGVPVAGTVAAKSLIGELDIGLSMVAMTLGMGYMLAVMLAL